MNNFEAEFLVVPDIEPVKVFLSSALNAKINGDGIQYDMIVKQLKVRDDPDTLWKVLIGLSSYTSMFTQRSHIFKSLLDAIFTYDWKSEKKVTVALINLIGHIVSSNTTFLASAFQLFVKSLLPNLTTTLAAETVDDSLNDRRRYIHAAIKAIMVQVPTGQSVLYPILEMNFPHKRFSRNVQTEYVSQLLVICEYFPVIQAKILDLIVGKCLEMDVEIVIEDSGDVRIHEEYEGEDPDDDFLGGGGVFAFDEEKGNNTSSRSFLGNGLGVNKNPQGTPSKGMNENNNAAPRIPQEVAEMADKLDSMMLLLVSHLDSEMNHSGSSRDRIMHQLSVIFEQRILSTHKSKFVQYCMFYVASKNAQFAHNFAHKLLLLALDSSVASINRQSAVMYLASYLSRANFLPPELVADVLSQLITWASAYVLRTGAATNAHSMPAQLPPYASTLRFSSDNVVTYQTNNGALQTSSPSVTTMRKSQSAPVLSLGDYAQQQNNQFVQEVEFDEFGRIVTQRENNVTRHEIFYSVVQSACYILCFYGTEMATQQRMAPMLKSHWECVVTSKYDPLRYCLKSVRIEFLKLSLHVGLFDEYCWEGFSPDLLYVDAGTVIYTSSANNDNGTTTTRDTSTWNAANANNNAYYSRLGLGSNPLDSFFPYDPCLLIKLHNTIEGGYRGWKGVPGLEEDEESLDDEEEEDLLSDGEESVRNSTAAIAIHRGRGGSHLSSSVASSVASSYAGTEAMSVSMGVSATAGSMSGELFMKALRNQQRIAHANGTNHNGIASEAHHSAHSSNVPAFDQWGERVGDLDAELHDEHHLHHHQQRTNSGGSSHSAAHTSNLTAAALGKVPRRPRQYSIGSNGSW